MELTTTLNLCQRTGEVIASGVMEALNNKATVTMRKIVGCARYRGLELVLYRAPGKLAEPKSIDDFFCRISTR
jgi:hypothetical protein